MANGTSSWRWEAARPRLSGLWRNGDFLRLWAGETISLFGSQVTALALPLTAVVLLDATPFQMGLLGAAHTIPFLLLALLAGVWVDRRRRRPVLVAANLARAALLGLVPLLASFGLLRIGYLVGIAFLVGAARVFFELAYLSYLPRLVRREELVEANGKLAASASVAEIGGPSLAGALIGVLSAPFALLLDGVSFLVSAASVSRIRRAEPEPEPVGEERRLVREIRDSFGQTFRNRYLLAFAAEAATYNVFWNTMQAVLVLYAVDELGMGAGTLGLVMSVGSAGALAGAVLTGRTAGRFGVGSTMIGSAVVSNVGTLLIPLVAAPNVLGLGLLAAAFFLRGVGMTGCNVQVYAVRQAIIPDRLQGRMNGTYRLLTDGFIPLGALLGGFLGEVIGLQPTLLVGAVGLFFSWVWLFCSPARTLHELPTPDGGEDTEA